MKSKSILNIVFTQPFRHRQDMTQGQFLKLGKAYLNFHSSRLVALTKLKISVYSIIYPWLKKNR